MMTEGDVVMVVEWGGDEGRWGADQGGCDEMKWGILGRYGVGNFAFWPFLLRGGSLVFVR